MAGGGGGGVWARRRIRVEEAGDGALVVEVGVAFNPDPIGTRSLSRLLK